MGEVAPQPDKVAMQGQACSAVAAAVPSPALCTVHTGGAGHMGGRWVPGSASAWWPSLCGEPQASRSWQPSGLEISNRTLWMQL